MATKPKMPGPETRVVKPTALPKPQSGPKPREVGRPKGLTEKDVVRR